MALGPSQLRRRFCGGQRRRRATPQATLSTRAERTLLLIKTEHHPRQHQDTLIHQFDEGQGLARGVLLVSAGRVYD